jgi:hypothetical protein
MPAPILPRRGMGALPPGLTRLRPRVVNVPGATVSAANRSYRGPSGLLDRLSMPALVLPPARGVAGLGGCGCGCGGDCQKGLGLFDSGFDFSQWGVAEWGIVAVGGYLAISLVADLFAAGRGVKKYKARISKRRAIRQKYQRELAAA